MSASTTTSASTTSASPSPHLWPVAVGAALIAAAATTFVAAVGDAAGISLDVAGEPIPLLGFANLTFGFALVGLAIAAGLRRWAADPRTAWIRTTVALTVLSLVPDVLADAAVETKLLLMTTHVVAAAIVVPVVASRLSRR